MIRDVTLSFDNGPTTAVTPHVLEVLARFNIKSTFFVLGKNLQTPETRALIEQASKAGHWIGNHTFTHSIPLGRLTDPQAPQMEIGRTQEIIAPVAHADKLFRPFGGGGKLGPHLLSEGARQYLVDGGFSCVLWNSIPHDWDDPQNWVETALAQCRELPWALVVLHDYDTGAMVHLQGFIERALAEGARFRQEFPPDCVPMLRGKAQMDMTPMVTPQPAAAH